MMNGQVSKKFIMVFFLFIPIQSLILVNILLIQKNYILNLCVYVENENDYKNQKMM